MQQDTWREEGDKRQLGCRHRQVNQGCVSAFFLQQKEGTRYDLHILDKKRGQQESGSTQKRQPSELHYVLGS